MVQTTIKQNLVPGTPELGDLLVAHKKDIFLSMNCHHVGTVQSFNSTLQTAKVTINYKKTYFQPNAQGVVMPLLRDYPVIVDAPVVFLGGGAMSMTFPVAQGDECLVLFNDRDIDNWFAGSNSSPNATPRLHAFADAIILVGIRSRPKVLTGFSAAGVEIRNRERTRYTQFRTAGGVFMVNPTGYFHFEDNADVAFDTGTVVGLFGNGGHVKFENATGELIAALITLFTTATAAGFPVIPDATALATLQSFQEI